MFSTKAGQESSIALCKIIEMYPELYDAAAIKRFSVDTAWRKVSIDVKKTLGQNVDPLELKNKWKCIRTCYNRFRNKLIQGNIKSTYYLYDHLKFLTPFTKDKGTAEENLNISDNFSETVGHSYFEIEAEDEADNQAEESDESEYEEKPNIENMSFRPKKRKLEIDTPNNYQITNNMDKEDEDMLFFKSLLRDVKKFTPKEKRMFKMKVLEVINDIEEQRETDE